jgi:hypothetical protein
MEVLPFTTDAVLAEEVVVFVVAFFDAQAPSTKRAGIR